MRGLYLHIPFCKSRCAYCDFFSTTKGEAVRSAFVDALCRELVLRRSYAGGAPVATVYFGGGTPSQLPAEDVARILGVLREHYTIVPEAEVTMEVNPDDVTPDYMEVVKRAGVNRISMGVQTFCDRLLRVINRRHTAQQARDAVRIIRNAGIDNVSIDLIYGLPGQTMAEWKNDVAEALRLSPSHISAYALSFEDGTPLSRMLEAGVVKEADEELSLAMYQDLMAALREAGFEHYEISNFALPGFRSRHNSSYWTGVPYLGVGPGAHSFDGVSRRENLPELEAYICANGDAPFEEERLTEDDAYNEMLMLGLRTSDGVNLAAVEARFGAARLQELLKAVVPIVADGQLVVEQGCLRQTADGIFLSDAILRSLFVVS